MKSQCNGSQTEDLRERGVSEKFNAPSLKKKSQSSKLLNDEKYGLTEL